MRSISASSSGVGPALAQYEITYGSNVLICVQIGIRLYKHKQVLRKKYTILLFKALYVSVKLIIQNNVWHLKTLRKRIEVCLARKVTIENTYAVLTIISGTPHDLDNFLYSLLHIFIGIRTNI